MNFLEDSLGNGKFYIIEFNKIIIEKIKTKIKNNLFIVYEFFLCCEKE